MQKTTKIGIAIVAVATSAILAWWLLTAQEEYRQSDRARVQLEMVAGALRGYADRMGHFPRVEQGLGVLIQEGDLKGSALIDPWGNQIAYRCIQPDCKQVEITSPGGGNPTSRTLQR